MVLWEMFLKKLKYITTSSNRNAGGYEKVAKEALGEGGHNRIFHTMGANDSLNGTTQTQIILSGILV